MSDGPEAGLARLDALETAAEAALRGYHLFPAARADMLRRVGRFTEASACFRRAADLATNAAERRFLERRAAEAARDGGF
jgi:RNA polymerase sigma-70 factor (ECF subfamily)